MLARTSGEVVDIDGLWDLVGACARQAVKDYQAGPQACGYAHWQTARRFLAEAGLLDRCSLPASAGPRQLDLFGD